MLTLRKYVEGDYEKWNQFVEDGINGTIFHRLDFLDYHGEKFKDNSHHLIWENGPKFYALLPLAVFVENGKCIAKSPFGASWGGFVHSGNLSLKNAILIVNELIDYLKSIRVDEIIFTPTPQLYYKRNNNFFEFAMLTAGFKLINRDIIHVVDLQEFTDTWDILDSKCRNQVRKGNQLFDINKDVEVSQVYSIIREDKERLKANITHTKAELEYLNGVLGSVSFDLAINKSDSSKACVCYFKCTDNVILTFYMAQETLARGKNGLNSLVFNGMLNAKNKGYKYFDFGTSSAGGKIINIGVSDFKESFGAKGFFRDTYKLSFQ